MIGFLRDFRDRMRGGGDYAITVPPMDGTLRPNNDLEGAEVLTPVAAPGHLSTVGPDLWCASESRVLRITADGEVETAHTYPSDITALAVQSADRMFVGLADGSWALPRGYSLDALPEAARRCVTGFCLGDNDAVFVAIGSTGNTAPDWPKDLLELGQSGSVWRLGSDGSGEQIAKGLGWPAGLIMQGGDLLVAEASGARLVRVTRDGRVTPVLSNLPGYPAGLCNAGDGGYFLCIMAPRNQLIEFILREREFVTEMIATSERDHWIAPILKAPSSFLEPLQGGALKQLGIMKPWAPSRSIGLVMHLNGDFVPTQSHHSRADGQNHGTTSCALWNGDLIVASQGNNRLLRLSQNGGHA